MRVHTYLQGHPDRGEWSSLACGPAAVPELPGAASPRRLDVFHLYRRIVVTNRELCPLDVFAAKIREVTVATAGAGSGGSVARGPNGQLFDELFSQPEGSIGLLERSPVVLVGPTAVITEVSGGDNYYHWLMTCLPKLLALMQQYGHVPFRHVVVNKSERAFVRQSLEYLGVGGDRILSAAENPVILAREGYFAHVRSDIVYPHPWVAALFRETFGRRCSAGRRLFISRRTGRHIGNEDEVLDILKPLGFEACVPETLPFSEQVRLFAEADAVVGPHGAGMSNIVFCRPGARVLEIFSPQQVSATYWFLAHSCGHSYHILIGRGEDLPLETNNWRSVSHPEIEVEAGVLRATLAEMCL